MSGSATKPQAMSFENGRKGEQPMQSAEFDFKVSMFKFREFKAASTVLLGKILELNKYVPNEGHRSELKEAPCRSQLESQKNGRSTYFQIAKEVVNFVYKWGV
jgi:hypothetical protein